MATGIRETGADVPTTTFVERLRDAVRWQSIKHLLLINTVIALALTVTGYRGNLSRTGWSFLIHLIYSMSIGGGIYFLSSSLDLDRITNKAVFLLTIACTFLVGGLGGALFAVWITTSFFDANNPLSKISPFLLEAGFFSLFFGFLGFAYFHFQERLRLTAEKLAEKELNEERLRGMKTQAELEMLRAKVRPHFLFNALNSIASLIQSDPDLAEDLVQKLSDLLRFAIQSSRSEWVSLAQEVALIRAYLAIEKARLGKRLSFDIQLPAEIHAVSIPVLLLQPLVENSIKHGIAPKREGGELSLRFEDLGERYRVDIKDTGRGWPQTPQEEGFGLGGVRERLALHFGNDYQLHIQNENGVRITIELPKAGAEKT